MHTSQPNSDDSRGSIPEKIWLARLARILPGDVLLTRNVFASNPADRAQSLAIRKGTGGRYSHVLMCAEIPTFIEAVGDGVSNISIQTCFAYDAENIRLLRYRDSKVAKKAGAAALMFLGRPYSVRSAIASILPELSRSSPSGHATFCSALVAAAYAAANSREFTDRNPMKVTPKTFEEIDGFEDITNEVFESVLTPPNLVKMSALDGDRVSNPIRDQQASLMAEHFYGVFQKCQALKSDFPELIDDLPGSFFELIEFLARGLDIKQRIDMNGSLSAMITRLQEIDREAYRRFADGRFEAMLDDTIRIDAASSIDLVRRSCELHPDIDIEDIKGMVKATEKQIEARSSFLTAYESYPSGLCLTLDAWIATTKRVIENMRNRRILLSEIHERLST